MIRTDHPAAAALAALPDEEPEALDSGPASLDLDPHEREGEPLPVVVRRAPASPLGATVARLLAGRRFRRFAEAHPEPGRYAEPVEVLDPYAVGVVLCRALWEHGYAAARDFDARLFLATPDPEHGWRLVGREDGVSAAQAAVRVTLDAIPPTVAEEDSPAQRRRYLGALAATRRLAETGSRGWTSWRDTVAREALERLSDHREIDADAAHVPWQAGGRRGRRASTVAQEARSAEHLATFLAYLPPGRHLSSTVRTEYARTAALSGVGGPYLTGVSDLLDALDDLDGVRRFRTGSGRWVEVPDPHQGAEAAAPLDPETRATLARILDDLRLARAVDADAEEATS